MRAFFSDTHLSATRRLALLLATVLLAALCAMALSEGSAPAKDLQSELQDTQGKLEHVHQSQSAVAASLAEENAAIDSMIGEVSKLRQRQAAVEAELAAKQDELDQATAELEKEKRHLEKVRAQLERALALLRDRLVAIYESGSPDAVDTILESSSWSDMAAQTEYLNRIQSYDDSVVGRVKALRNQVRDAVQRLAVARAKIESARDEIAVEERQVAAARAQAEARFAELKEAQAQRRQTMEALESREQALNDNLASISSQMAAAGGPVATGEAPAPLTPGETAGFINESEASAPASAPEAIKEAISAANSIATTPYIWGGGHGSFEDSGYDCSGATSFALHGGGFLESPLDSTGLETWGEPGPGRWITVYANAEHAWMTIAGLAFDTVGGPGPRWHSSLVDSPEGFIARHPPGY
jgi:peptidoglycan hydrolase CwlO-like protein